MFSGIGGGLDGLTFYEGLQPYIPCPVRGMGDTIYFCPADVKLPSSDPTNFIVYPDGSGAPADLLKYGPSGDKAILEVSYMVNSFMCPWLMSGGLGIVQLHFVRPDELEEPEITAFMTDGGVYKTTYFFADGMEGAVDKRHDGVPTMLFADGSMSKFDGAYPLNWWINTGDLKILPFAGYYNRWWP